MSKDNDEINDLRQLVKDLTRKNEELQAGKSGNDSTSQQASAELAEALNSLRRRVSCMDRKMESGGGGGGRRSEYARKSSVFDSSWSPSELMEEPGSSSGKVMLDLTGGKGGGKGGGGRNDQQRRSSAGSVFMDLTDLRGTFAQGGDDDDD